jgi:hypothetical protein
MTQRRIATSAAASIRAAARPLALTLALAASALATGCVFAPPSTVQVSSSDIAKMGEQAVATCGAGQVKEVNAKSFSCK